MAYIDLVKLRKKQELRRQYLGRRERAGYSLCGMGGDHRFNNKTSALKIRQYGFQRFSTQQKQRLTSKVLTYKKNKTKIKCYKMNAYLYSRKINQSYKNNDLSSILVEIYNAYSDPNKLIQDFDYGYRDLIFAKTIGLTKIKDNDTLMYLFLNEYEDILMDVLVAFIKSCDNYVETSKTSFYTYIIYTLPFLFSYSFSRVTKRVEDTNVEIDGVAVYNHNYDCINLLGAHVLNEFGIFNYEK